MNKYTDIDIFGNCESLFKHPKPMPCPDNEFYNDCYINLVNSYRFYLAFENLLCNTMTGINSGTP